MKKKLINDHYFVFDEISDFKEFDISDFEKIKSGNFHKRRLICEMSSDKKMNPKYKKIDHIDLEKKLAQRGYSWMWIGGILGHQSHSTYLYKTSGKGGFTDVELAKIELELGEGVKLLNNEGEK